MGHLTRAYEFESSAPRLDSLVAHAEAMGGLRLKTEGEPDDFLVLSFKLLAGSVALRRYERRLVVTYGGAEAPVLVDLMDLAIRELGGESEDLPKAQLELPLDEQWVITATQREQALLADAVRPIWRAAIALAGIVLLTLIALIWLLASLF